MPLKDSTHQDVESNRDSNEALKAGDETDNVHSVKKEGEENLEFYLEH